MKINIIYILVAAALTSCAAFTAPKDSDGMRQDAPPEWDGTPNPLDVPGNAPITGRHFGPNWLR